MEKNGYQLDHGTDEACVGCGDEVLLVTAEDGSAQAQCGCSSVTVLVPA